MTLIIKNLMEVQTALLNRVKIFRILIIVICKPIAIWGEGYISLRIGKDFRVTQLFNYLLVSTS